MRKGVSNALSERHSIFKLPTPPPSPATLLVFWKNKIKMLLGFSLFKKLARDFTTYHIIYYWIKTVPQACCEYFKILNLYTNYTRLHWLACIFDNLTLVQIVIILLYTKSSIPLHFGPHKDKTLEIKGDLWFCFNIEHRSPQPKVSPKMINC
jgi:hypothetical protein